MQVFPFANTRAIRSFLPRHQASQPAKGWLGVIARNFCYDINTRSKPHVNVGTIGHVDHGKTTLTAAITKVLPMLVITALDHHNKFGA